MNDWRTDAAKSPAWPEFLQWAGDGDVPYYSGNLARTRWDAFQAGVIVGQGLGRMCQRPRRATILGSVGQHS